MKTKDGVVFAVAFSLAILLGSLAYGVPSDIAPLLQSHLENVVQRLQGRLQFGSYLFAPEAVDLGEGVLVFANLERLSPCEALLELEKGIPIARFCSPQGLRLGGTSLPPGDYYGILWLCRLGFERFGYAWPRRVPLLLFATAEEIVFADFAIPTCVEVDIRGFRSGRRSSVILRMGEPISRGAIAACQAEGGLRHETSSEPQGELSSESEDIWRELAPWGVGTILYCDTHKIGSDASVPQLSSLCISASGPGRALTFSQADKLCAKKQPEEPRTKKQSQKPPPVKPPPVEPPPPNK